MIFALGARQKIGFIDGTCPKPTQDQAEIEQWQKTDCMVITWILNSISKNIVEAFLYTTSARDLWLELESRFGESNGPLLYQIQIEIGPISQNNNSVAIYYTNLKRLWDELAALDPIPSCSCGAGKKIAEKIVSTQLIQFLVGLSDAYDHVRNQMLLMDPLPSIDSGASTHMCMNRSLFKSLQPLKNKSFIKLPNGSSCEVEHAGNIDISQHIILEDVLYVPVFNYNLLSVSKLCASGHLSVIFLKEQCLVQDLVTRKVIAIGRQ
ncbi:UNVERIFIED_CONTAM: hypothetical protein Sindi_1020600 [Sesamum indicum]